MSTPDNAALSKARRDALADHDFASPGSRKLPIHDERHVRLAWASVDKVALSDSERADARKSILQRAGTFGLDTSGWHQLTSVNLQAMSLNISAEEHVNKMPFSGVLVKLDQSSDAPPGGSAGKRINLTSAAAEAAIPSLLGMAVDYTPKFDGHDARAKIGIITSAEVVGDELLVEGFVYASDFPVESQHIRNNKDSLGFSFEARDIYVADPSENPMKIVKCTFTGAAILEKDKAAYRTTSISAHAENEATEMTHEEIIAAIQAGNQPLMDRLAEVESKTATSIEALSKSTKEQLEAQSAKIEANRSVMDMVEPHAKHLEDTADGMQAAGIGGDATRGHPVMLRKMASSMRSEAALGRVPNAYSSYDMHAGADTGREQALADQRKALETTHLAALSAAAEKAKTDLESATKPLKEEIASLTTKVTDITAAARKESQEPERHTAPKAKLDRHIATIAASKGYDLDNLGDKKLTDVQVGEIAAAASMTDVSQRIALKTALTAAGVY